MKPTHRLTKDATLCGRPDKTVPAGSEVQVVLPATNHESNAWCRVSEDSWQYIPMSILEPITENEINQAVMRHVMGG